ncbi:phosphotransferase [Candidatus Uhrbacteria bacterium]|nr:phosphotransferase [Candidatus Uhrbacteria bacterium]
MNQKVPRSILRQYNIGTILEIKPISIGLIHKTFSIKTDKDQYIIQRLHPILSSQGTAQDFFNVTRFLNLLNFSSPICIKTKQGKILAENKKEKWRLQTKLPGKTFDRLTNVPMAKEAGRIYGQFHLAIDKAEFKFHSTLVLHESKKVYRHFCDVLKKIKPSPLMNDVRREIEIIKKEFPNYFLPSDLPKHVIHGDPKISNILFSGSKALAVIDLDTCQRQNLLVELGDAFRSWCGKCEDDPHNTFSLSLFRASWDGYKNGSNGLMTKREINLVSKSIGLITLELACRFLSDYFEDCYFGWDDKKYPSRRAHNLARCCGQLAEFQDFKRKIEEINNIIK